MERIRHHDMDKPYRDPVLKPRQRRTDLPDSGVHVAKHPALASAT